MNCFDANSCLFDHGKRSLYENMENNSEACCLLLSCGDSCLPLKEDVSGDLKSYTIRYMHSGLETPALDMARAAKWKRRKKSLLCLPLDDSNLKQHLMHANVLAYIQHEPELRKHPLTTCHGQQLL